MSDKLHQNADSNFLQLVTFNVGGEEFGVDILAVQEINRMSEVTRVPNTPEFVEGVINLRGKVIPIIDLRRRIGMPNQKHDKNTRIVVVELEQKIIGFVVDSVSKVLTIDRNITEAPPPMVAGIEAEYITSIAKFDNRLIILLDLNKILTIEEQKEIKAALENAA